MLTKLTTNTNGPTITEQLPDHALALYIHIPFCRTRCTYCAFNTYTGQTGLVGPYTTALLREIQRVAETTSQRHIRSIYFGGGTPSLMPASALKTIINACDAVFTLNPDIEITLEANPGTIDIHYLRQLRALGINRLSIGMQSAHAHELKLFARTHTLEDVHTTVRLARQTGFDSISVDLIYGIPHQTPDEWRSSLAACCALNVEHVSLYSLSIEDATPLQQNIDKGKLAAPDPDRAADMYDLASEYLAQTGYVQYEISNWAKPGHHCRHNMHVWRNLPYLGFGAGAHGYAAHTRYANTPLPQDYITRLENQTPARPFPLSPVADKITSLTPSDVISETLIMGLRLIQEGIAYPAFEARFGRSLEALYGTQIAQLITAGLLEQTPDRRIRLTPRARLIANQVFVEFI